MVRLPRVSCSVSMSRFFGALEMSPGRLRFEPHGRMNAALNFEPPYPLEQHQPDLYVFVGRLRPPWMNSPVLIIDDHSETVGSVLLSGPQRDRLVEEAAIYHFNSHIYKSWCSIGSSISSRSELAAFLRTCGQG